MIYFAKISYLGTNFHGFQVQPGLRTVQGELSRALEEALGAPCKVTGCSRTDAGVHANEFCVKIECEGATVPADKLDVAVARYLSPDLSLYYAEECSEHFHPRYDVKFKEYVYIIRNRRVFDPFDFGRVWFLPREIDENAIARMNEAAAFLIGEHDFRAFMAEGSDVESTVRHIFDLSVSKKEDKITVKISADGFLYNMVRIIVGTLIDVAYGKFSPLDVKKILDSKDRKNAGMTAVADGLYLNRVVY